MYFVIAKLDIHRLANFDFLINFGVTMEQRNIMLTLMENGGDFHHVASVIEKLPFN
jgi:hypothetical protein